jgi:protein O-GlcNAc transferase
VQLRPDFAEAYNNFGNAFQANAEPDKALSCYQKAVQLKPDSAYFYYNVANAFQRQGKFDKAISCYQAALRLKPDVAEVHYDMGNAFHGQGEFQGAIRSFRRAVRLRPNYPEAYNNMGNAFQADGDLDEAIACYQKALRLKPELTEALSNMGDALQEQGRCGEAIACYEQALALKPNSGIEVKRFFALPVICESRESIRRYRKGILDNIVSSRGKSISLENPSKQVGSTSFYLPYHGLNDKEMQEQIASFYIRTCPDLVWSTSGWNSKERREGTKIHIGIISKFLFNHTVGKLNLGIVENLSRVKFHVKLFQFPGKEDELSKAFRKAADEVVVLPSELKTAREEIAGQSLDILFYLDIGMEPLTYFLAFSRLAPVQCVTWGHPVSTGIPNMDYFISSEKAEPAGAEEHYSERLVCLQRLGIYYHRLELSEEPSSREKFGLPRGQTLYVCPQSLFKFHPDFDHILGAILRQDPNGLLVLIEGKHKNWTKLLRDRFARAFSDDVDRVRFQSRMPEKDFLSFLMVADAVLDTPHFGGGNTTLESLACGVPVVTWPGVFMRGRLTLALYKQLGVMDCVASSAESFVNIALRLANDKTWREEIKGKITTRVDVLYEDIEAVRELECFFEQAVKEAHKKNWAS